MSERALVVLTQNAWGGAAGWSLRLPLLRRAIDKLHPDVVGLQEVHAEAGARDDESQAHQLATELGDYHATFAPGRVDAQGHREGVALLTRRDVRTTAVEKLTLDRNDPWDGASQRVVLHARIDALQGEQAFIDLFVTHLSLSRPARSRTIGELLAFVDRTVGADAGGAGQGRDAVLMGDLNATPDEEIITRLGERWIDAWGARHPHRRGGTWPAIFPRRRFDYVFVPRDGGLVIETCHRLPYAGSDHLGVVAHLRRAPT